MGEIFKKMEFCYLRIGKILTFLRFNEWENGQNIKIFSLGLKFDDFYLWNFKKIEKILDTFFFFRMTTSKNWSKMANYTAWKLFFFVI